MKKRIIKYFIPSLMFFTTFSFGIISNTHADPPAGELCCNDLPGCCQWFNEDGSLDFECDGDWYQEQQ